MLKGKTVVLGIRPEDIKDEEMFISNSQESIVDVTVRVYELLGAEVFLYLDVDQYEITARVNPRTTARPGDAIKVAFDLSKMHIFDKETAVRFRNEVLSKGNTADAAVLYNNFRGKQANPDYLLERKGLK